MNLVRELSPCESALQARKSNCGVDEAIMVDAAALEIDEASVREQTQQQSDRPQSMPDQDHVMKVKVSCAVLSTHEADITRFIW